MCRWFPFWLALLGIAVVALPAAAQFDQLPNPDLDPDRPPQGDLMKRLQDQFAPNVLQPLPPQQPQHAPPQHAPPQHAPPANPPQAGPNAVDILKAIFPNQPWGNPNFQPQALPGANPGLNPHIGRLVPQPNPNPNIGRLVPPPDPSVAPNLPPPPSAPPVYSAEWLETLTYEELRAAGVEALAQFVQGLGTGQSAVGWRRHLELESLVVEFAQQQTGPPSAATRERLDATLAKFEAVDTKSEYRVIRQTPGFANTLAVLTEYVRPPAEHQARVLSHRLRGFVTTLDGLKVGPGWKKYLQTDLLEEVSMHPHPLPLTPELTTRLKAVAERFQTVRQDPKFAVVAKLRGFAATADAAELFVDTVLQEHAESQPEPPSGDRQLPKPPGGSPLPEPPAAK